MKNEDGRIIVDSHNSSSSVGALARWASETIERRAGMIRAGEPLALIFMGQPDGSVQTMCGQADPTTFAYALRQLADQLDPFGANRISLG